MHLGSHTILEHSIMPFQNSADIDDIVVVLPSQYVSAYSKKLRKKFCKISSVVSGGKSRTFSVINGLKATGEASIYLIHDGVRPFVWPRLIKEVIKGARRYGACIAAVRATDTVKESNGQSFISKTLRRNRIYLVQTPQGFRKDVITEGVDCFLKNKSPVTDDSALAEGCGVRVKIIESDWINFKITTRKDLKIARKLQDLLNVET